MTAAVLRLTETAASDGEWRILAEYEPSAGSEPRQTASSAFAFEWTERDREDVRWYLEDYLEWPFPPAPITAAAIERRIAELGAELFRKVFGHEDARDLWVRARSQLSHTRIEIAAGVSGATTLPWELLRDPRTDQPLVLDAESFVHVDHQPARLPRLPRLKAGERLRVLLAICRPAGSDDVPFRSVAGHLIRHSEDARRTLTLDVLRPPTFARLNEVLTEAARAGRPYHVVHFDGHGAYTDDIENVRAPGEQKYSVLSPVRAGAHGYLLFEDPETEENLQLVDGPALGALLARTGVPVLVLNACRSAYAQTPSRPADDQASDIHGRVRAFGSLAQEVAHAGVPGVVSMRYNVYVVTATQFVAKLYTELLSGKTLGVAVQIARAQLAAQPHRVVGSKPIALQDWPVPIVHEAKPLPLFTAAGRERLEIQLAQAVGGDDGGLPQPPDAGFFGRDSTLLALDRAFDAEQIVLLQGYAGSGKSTTAAEFARWYRLTGGLHDGAVLFSSFETHLPLSRLLDRIGDTFGAALEAAGVHWLTLADAQRREVALQVLGQIPVLWVWDNVEPVAGFPAGSESQWSADEQAELARFLRELRRTRARVLLTSRRDERGWLGDLPTYVRLPPMPMPERVRLAEALISRQGGRPDDLGTWSELLEYSGGNPMALTVLVGQALRAGLTSTGQVSEFVSRLRSGEAQIADEDAALGRTRSLAASLAYGFREAFNERERPQLAVLHLFQQNVYADLLRSMGAHGNPAALDALAGLTADGAARLLGRAVEIGLLEDAGRSVFRIHPAVPWFLAGLFAEHYGEDAARSAQRAYTATVADFGNTSHNLYVEGHGGMAPVLAAMEANLRRAMDLARGFGWWDGVVGCMQGLRIVCEHYGRDAEWARLVEQLVPDVVGVDDRPLPGREAYWSLLTEYRIRIARDARDWATAGRLQDMLVAWDRERAAEALLAAPDALTDVQRGLLYSLAAGLHLQGQLLRLQGDARCVQSYQEAADLARRIGARRQEASAAYNLGNAYLDLPPLRDLDAAERWFRHALGLIEPNDRLGLARYTGQLGTVAHERLRDARKAGQGTEVLIGHLNAALERYTQALSLVPQDAVAGRGTYYNQLGNLYSEAGMVPEALEHYRQAIALGERLGDRYGAAQTRFNVAVLLAYASGEPRLHEARLYAEAAIRDYQAVGSGGAAEVENVRAFLADIARREAESGA
jgi:tetratricopeptide (TPR) repeat protein